MTKYSMSVGHSSAWVISVVLVVCALIQPLRGLSSTYATQSAGEVCTASEVAQPRSVEEVSALVKGARKAGQKVKVVGTRHSTTDIICTDGLALDLSLMKAVEVNLEEREATIQTGATQEEVHAKLAEAGFSVIHPFAKYLGMTIGGLLATGSISSSIKQPASISDQVIALTLVDGLGEVRKIVGEDLKAARVNLGYLGVITDVTLKILPNFKIKLEATRHDESILFDGSVNAWAEQADYFEIMWFPFIRSAIALTGTYMDITTPGTDKADFVFETSDEFVRSVDAASASRNADFFCLSESPNAEGWITGHPGIPQMINKNGQFTNPATGLMTDVLTSSCIPGQCAWDNPSLSYLTKEIHLAIPINVFPEAMRAVRDIIDRRSLCTISITGIFIRFQGASSNYLSTAHGTAAGQLEILQPLRQDDNQTHFGLATEQEIFQTMQFNFPARPHWGKNARSSFSPPFRSLEEAYPDWPKFLAVKKRLDPEGIFENDFYDRLTGKKSIDKSRHCATDDKCICSEDSHCAQGQKCEVLFIGDAQGGVCLD